jgi:hypothetical protein
VTGTLPTANGGTNLGGATPFTSGGVVYASSSSALATGSRLKFDGTTLSNTVTGGIVTSTELLTLDRDNSGTFIKFLRSAGSGNTGGLIGADSVGVWFAGATTANMLYVDASTDSLQFHANSAERMRLTSTGLGIGTSSPAAKLDVLNSADQTTLKLYASNASYSSSTIFLGADRNTSNNTFYAFAYYNYGAGAYKFRVADSGAISTAGSISLGASTPATSGIGVQFPATQSASSDANTLDDYEEGTWTPALGGFSSITYSAQTGTYTKIGNVVNVVCKIVVSGGTRTVADAQIFSLPFTSASQENSGGSWGYGYGVVASSVGLPQLRINASATTVSLLNTAGGVLAGTDLNTATPTINFSATYTV